MSQAKHSEIILKIELDNNNIPSKISWDAADNDVFNKEAKALMLSLWDQEEENTMRIDLWTKDMMVDEMKKFIHQSILLMADTLQRAAGEEEMAHTMRDFGAYYAEKLNLLPPDKQA